jgi:hypothetical protein
MKPEKKAATVWVAVKVWRGILVEAKAFHKQHSANRCEATWRRHLNLNNDDTGVFELTVK